MKIGAAGASQADVEMWFELVSGTVPCSVNPRTQQRELSGNVGLRDLPRLAPRCRQSLNQPRRKVTHNRRS